MIRCVFHQNDYSYHRNGEKECEKLFELCKELFTLVGTSNLVGFLSALFFCGTIALVVSADGLLWFVIMSELAPMPLLLISEIIPTISFSLTHQSPIVEGELRYFRPR
jgi:hypothetical protein